MKWISVSEQMPPVDPRTGESEYVFVYPGHRCLPQVAMYSNGMYSRKGWHPATDMGRIISLHKGKGENRRPSFTHWMKIELPEDE